jgi:hypothetical protein
VTKWFPDAEDAIRLKQELIDGKLVPSAQLELLWYVLAHGNEAVFPPPTDAGVGRLALLWPERSGDLLHLAERTANAEDSLERSVFATIAGAVPAEAFWLATESYPRLRERMIVERPDLLTTDGALNIDNDTVVRMLRLIKQNASVAESLIPHLLLRDDERLASETFDLFPQETALQVVTAFDSGNVRKVSAWLRELVERPHLLLDPAVLGRIGRASLLYEIADALGWLTPKVVSMGTEPWIAALDNVESDLSDDRRDILYVFLVALAISAGGEGGRRILERLFDTVHEREMKSKLPWRARDILLPVLAEVHWTRSWDYGLRLRIAVAAAYVRNSYSPESYAALSNRRKLRAMLSDAAADIPGGEIYAKAVA